MIRCILFRPLFLVHEHDIVRTNLNSDFNVEYAIDFFASSGDIILWVHCHRKRITLTTCPSYICCYPNSIWVVWPIIVAALHLRSSYARSCMWLRVVIGITRCSFLLHFEPTSGWLTHFSHGTPRFKPNRPASRMAQKTRKSVKSVFSI